MADIEFINLPMLIFLPLALLPLLRSTNESLSYSWAQWLPEDKIGKHTEWLWKMLCMLSMLAIIIGLAGPGVSETRIEQTGRGAELSIVLDRSSSMDAGIRRMLYKPGDKSRTHLPKKEIVVEAISQLLRQRPDNRYALTLFNAAPMHVAPFTDDVAIVKSGLESVLIGRGPSETNMGLGILAAIEAYEGRSYSGSRAILLVSDGGAKLAEDIRAQIAQGLADNRISLYFIYIASSPNSPKLETVGTDVDSSLEEVALHTFFKGLGSEYQVFQAADDESMAKAIELIGEQENLPLTYYERVPRIDYSRIFLTLALISTLLLLVLTSLRLVSWL